MLLLLLIGGYPIKDSNILRAVTNNSGMKSNIDSTIAKEIIKLREEYMSDEGITLWDIGNGLCESFCLDLMDRLYEIDNSIFVEAYEVCNHSFMIGEGESKYGNDLWDLKLLKDSWNIEISPAVEAVTFGLHVWMTFRGKHYDCETPEGVTDFFKLPFFKRYLVSAE